MFGHRQVPAFFNIKLVAVKSSLAVCDSIVCLVTSLLAEDEFAGVKFGVALFTACVNVQACVKVRSSYGFLCVFIISFSRVCCSLSCWRYCCFNKLFRWLVCLSNSTATGQPS